MGMERQSGSVERSFFERRALRKDTETYETKGEREGRECEPV
jgi:hypothetical protein